jgi:hypothetical protein
MTEPEGNKFAITFSNRLDDEDEVTMVVYCKSMASAAAFADRLCLSMDGENYDWVHTISEMP